MTDRRPLPHGRGSDMAMVRNFLIGCFALLALIVGWYRFSSATPRADFTYVRQTAANTLDPAAVTWNQDIRLVINLWEGLAAHDPHTGEPIDGCAFSPTVSADGLFYTFAIKPRSRWSNGDPVTAHDFVRGWRRAIEPGTAAEYAVFITDHVAGARDYYQWRNGAVGQLSSMPHDSPAWRTSFEVHAAQRDERFHRVGIRAIDDRTLEVRLTRPCAYFLDLCTFPALMPIHQSIDKLRIDLDGSGLTPDGLVLYDPQWTKPGYHTHDYPGLITNGPFVLSEWIFKRRMRLTANPLFREAQSVGCRTIDVLVHSDLNTAIMAYEAGDVDFLPETSVTYDHELVRLAETGSRRDFHNTPVFATYYYLFNSSDPAVDGRPNPFVDPRVRKAFALSIDKRLMAENVVGRGNPPIDNIVPPGIIAGYASPAGLGHDPDEARRLLADAGYPNGAGLPPIDLLYNTGFHHGKVCDALAEMWRAELGAVVIPRGKELKSFVEDRRSGRFMIARAGWYGDYPDPTTFLNLFVTGNGNNYARYRDPRFDDLMNRAKETRDAARRLEILAEAERRLIRETLPVLMLYQDTQLLAIKPYVRGLHPNPRLIFPFRYVTVAP